MVRSPKNGGTGYLDSRNSDVFCCRYLSMPDTNRFQVLARPKMVHRANVGSRLDYVEFFASHEAEDLRIWRMAEHDLVILFDIVESSELVADLICELHEGTSVTLPRGLQCRPTCSAGVSHPGQETTAACEPSRQQICETHRVRPCP